MDSLDIVFFAFLAGLVDIIAALVTFRIGWKVFKPRVMGELSALKPRLKAEIDQYIAEKLIDMTKNPSEYAKVLKPVFDQIMKDFGVDPGSPRSGRTVNVPILGKVPVELVTGFMRMFGGKAIEGAQDAAVNW